MSDVEREVIRVVAEQLDLDEDQVTAGANLTVDLGAEALDVVEILAALRTRFGVEIDDDEAERIAGVGDLVAAIEHRLA